MTALQHYKTTIKKSWMWLILLLGIMAPLVIKTFQVWPPTSFDVTIVTGIVFCLFYLAIRREGSLENSIILGTILPGIMALEMYASPIKSWWLYGPVGLFGAFLMCIHWREYFVKHRTGED